MQCSMLFVAGDNSTIDSSKLNYALYGMKHIGGIFDIFEKFLTEQRFDMIRTFIEQNGS